MDASVAAPFGLNSADRIRHLAYVEALAKCLNVELAEALNKFHGVSNSPRFWEILLGHWLKRCVMVLFNRYFTVEQTLANSPPLETIVFDSKNYSLSTNDSIEFIWACGDDEWNHVLYKEIFEFLGVDKISFSSGPPIEDKDFSTSKGAPVAIRLNAKKVVLAVANFFLPKLSRERDALIINTYLSLFQEAGLQLLLGQCPQIWRTPALEMTALDQKSRQDLSIDVFGIEGFEKFVRLLVTKMLPRCYLEGYAALLEKAEQLPWPKKPRFIFASNRFDTDEVFKAWVAKKVGFGTPYFAGQHGNNYGTHLWLTTETWPERSSSDRFITWGKWVGAKGANAPAFVFRNVGKKVGQFDPAGGILLIENLLFHRLDVGDIYHGYSAYQEAQFRFVESLPVHIHSRLTVRLHRDFKRLGWADDIRWKDRSPSTFVEKGVLPINALIGRSRLVVHSYDSTGTLETLALNIPTLCFWWNSLEDVLPVMRPYYEVLKNAGILIESPEVAAQFVKERWDDIGHWWANEVVQTARGVFCEQFALSNKTPVRTLRDLLCKLESECQQNNGTSKLYIEAST